MGQRQQSPGSFGKRSSPPRLIYARGSQVKALTVRGWMIGVAAASGLACLTWLICSTVYVFYNDDLVEIAHNYQTEMQRDYEDRIASLRAQIEDITTRRYLDQQAVEARMQTLTATQEEISARQSRMTALLEDAQKRGLALGETSPTTTGSIAPTRPRPLLARFSSLRGTSAGRNIDLVDAGVDTLAARLDDLSAQQGEVVATLERGVDDRYRSLAEVPKALGLRAAGHDHMEAMGGPFIPARGDMKASMPVDQSLEQLEGSFAALKALENQVRKLPVRKPLSNYREISSDFGTRRDPFLGRLAFHSGIDFAASRGMSVRATGAGQVTIAGRNGGYGLMVEVDHGNGLRTRYAHLSRIEVAEGDMVAVGSVVGRVGSTGRSTGPHLHYETRRDGEPVDPTSYIAAGDLLPKSQ
ncbi:MAG: peptidoglycan DD-metalloendopeptidase family protein [Rhodobiaceae bacterium]|nr:peptidoglycan DD-metalloendopeptidase family protein [Rhodobiaceae bacterium]MCC0056971.1 peptidoglycan DD-metalloendopeptidase family protein [Rhodobiaceae bacterium]